MVGLGIAAGRSALPNINFYLFAAIALGASLRVISHPRPVYAALYFILTILSSAGLYVLLSAEFMAFALVIVYAGAILITYLFVIMLATETPTADQVEALSEYDRYSREPAVATVIGFMLVAGMTTLMATGVGALPAAGPNLTARDINDLPRRVEDSLRSAGLIDKDEAIVAEDVGGRAPIDLVPRNGGPGHVVVAFGTGRTRVISTDDPKWPSDLKLTNIEGVGFTLLRDHPGSIEVAGVVLLMAMLGAVVLAQKKVELDEAAKLAAQGHSVGDMLSASGSPLMGPERTGSPNFREAELQHHAANGTPTPRPASGHHVGGAT
jgi:NADH-quinone oxidoreductase subunit J